MARKPRMYYDDSYQHIMHRGNNRREVFLSNSDYTRFYLLIRKYLLKFKIFIYHYCLMPNHLHILCKTSRGYDLSKFMQGISLSYTQYYKKKYGYIGSLWQGRHKSILIENESYLRECGRYIERNPLRANLVNDISDYLYSSYNFYAHGKSNLIVAEDEYYKDMGKTDRTRQRRYREFLQCERPYDTVLDKVLSCDWVDARELIRFGSDKFTEMERGLALRSVPLGPDPGSSGKCLHAARLRAIIAST